MSLISQIKYVEQTIISKEELGEDASFERELVKEWKRYLPGGDKHHLWLQHSDSARHAELQCPPNAPESKSRRVKR